MRERRLTEKPIQKGSEPDKLLTEPQILRNTEQGARSGALGIMRRIKQSRLLTELKTQRKDERRWLRVELGIQKKAVRRAGNTTPPTPITGVVITKSAALDYQTPPSGTSSRSQLGRSLGDLKSLPFAIGVQDEHLPKNATLTIFIRWQKAARTALKTSAYPVSRAIPKSTRNRSTLGTTASHNQCFSSLFPLGGLYGGGLAAAADTRFRYLQYQFDAIFVIHFAIFISETPPFRAGIPPTLLLTDC